MRRLRQIPVRPLLAVLGVAFFFAPALAFVAGERAEPIENRPLAKLPSLSRGFGAFDDLTQWGVDHLPLRDTAVRVHTRVTRELLGEVPVVGQVNVPVGVGQGAALAGEPARADPINGGSVVVGRDGWLFLSNEFERACRPGRAPADVIASVRRLASILERSGRRLVLGIPPDKGSMVPSLVPDDYPLKACSERARAQRAAVLHSAALPGFVDLEAVLAREQRRAGRPLYLKFDTHWTDLGGTVAARAVLRAVNPELLRGTRTVRLRDRKRVEDLAFIAGDTDPRPQQRHALVRPGVKVTELQGSAGGRHSEAHGSSLLFRRDALIYGDSFAQRTFGQFRPYFADLTFLPVVTSPAATVAESFLRAQIRGSELFVLLKGERGFWSNEQFTVLSDRFLDKLEKTLLPAGG